MGNPYKKCKVYSYIHWGKLRWTYALSKVSFDSEEQAKADRKAMAERHERIARLSVKQRHGKVRL